MKNLRWREKVRGSWFFENFWKERVRLGKLERRRKTPGVKTWKNLRDWGNEEELGQFGIGIEKERVVLRKNLRYRIKHET